MVNIFSYGLNLIKAIRSYKNDPISFLANLKNSQGQFAHVKIFHKNFYLITNPNDIEIVLSKHQKNYIKGKTTQNLKMFLGEGLLTSEGENWKEQHKELRGIFKVQNLKSSSKALQKWSRDFVTSLDSNCELDLYEESKKLILNMSYSFLLSKDAGEGINTLRKTDEILDYISLKGRSLFHLDSLIPTPKKLAFLKAKKEIEFLIRNDITQNEAFSHSFLMTSAKSSENPLRAPHLIDQILTFLVAGYETTSTALIWTLIELAENEHFQEQIRQEVLPFKEKDGMINDDFFTTNQGQNLEHIILESLRLHPPVWALMRESIKDDQLSDHHFIKKGGGVVIGTYLIHRDPQFWEDPNKFNPERFKSPIEKNYLNAFFPFGLGPRVCIGSNLAILELKIILAHLCSTFSFKIKDRKNQTFSAGTVLRPTNNTFFSMKKLTNE